jgi:hypothetical protein
MRKTAQHFTQGPSRKKFQQGSKNLFDAYFFPYGLIENSALTKSAVYGALRERWKKNNSPEQIVKALSNYQNAFLDLACGTNYQGHSKPVSDGFRRLFDAGLPNSTYPFLMQLSNSCRDHALQDTDVIAILEVVESFLVRRAICGHEPTGLHAVFKGLWNDCSDTKTGESVIETIRAHKTVPWPNDTEVPCRGDQ